MNKLFSQRKLATLILMISISSLFLYKIGKIPLGLFCDEAEIALSAHEFFWKNGKDFVFPLFYQHLDGYLVGALAPVLQIPIVLLFGLSDFSARFASVILGIISFYFVYRFLLLIKFKSAHLSTLLISAIPLVFHLVRINFGHTASMLFFVLGMIFFEYALKTRKQIYQNFLYALLGGLFLGLSAYGYGSFLMNVMVFLFSIFISLLIVIRSKKALLMFLFFVLGVTIVISPILYRYKYDKQFQKRLIEKTTTVGASKDPKLIVQNIIQNYPKYFSLKYLVHEGELGMGGFITRHSIPNHGVLFASVLIMMTISLFGLKFLDKNQKLWLVWAIIFYALHPFADLLTTNIKYPPYTFAVFNQVFALLIFVGVFSHLLTIGILSKKKVYKTLSVILLILMLFIYASEWTGYFRDYQRYPEYSSEFSGWQYGPGEIIKFYKNTNQQEWDDMFLPGNFNGPTVFLPFYDSDTTCIKCKMGRWDRLDKNKKQIFADEPGYIPQYEKFGKIQILHTIYYPNNKPAYYIITLSK